MTSASELAPQEDQGVVLSQVIGPPNATYQQMQKYSDMFSTSRASCPSSTPHSRSPARRPSTRGSAACCLKPWDERKRSADELQKLLQEQWNQIPGARVAAFQFPSLPGTQGFPCNS